MKVIAYTIMSLLTALPELSESSPTPPQAEIANSVVGVKIYMPHDPGFRGTGVRWSGVVDLQYAGHSCYGP
jgi:hypothetical protein